MIRINIDGLTVDQINVKYQATIQRGIEVMYFVVQGMTDDEIARSIYLSIGAVKNRLKSYYVVIGARNRTHAVGITIANGWMPAETMLKVLASREFRPNSGTNLPNED